MATPQSSAELVGALDALKPNAPAVPVVAAAASPDPAVAVAAAASTAAAAAVAAPAAETDSLLSLQLASVEATKASLAAPDDQALKVRSDASLKAVNDFVAKGTAPAPPQVEPQKVKLALPADATVDQSAVNRIESFAQKHGFSQPQADALLANERENVLENRARASEFQKRFLETIQSDPELGGTTEQVNSKMAKAELGMRHSFTEGELLELKKLGLDKAPAIVRASFRFYNMALASPSLVQGAPVIAAPRRLDVNNPDELAQAVAQSRKKAGT